MTRSQRTLLLASPDGGVVYAVGGEKVRALARDTETGELRFFHALFGLPRSILAAALSPDGRDLYGLAFGETLRELFGCRLEPDGSLPLSFSRDCTLLTDVPGLTAAASLAVSPDGAHIYAASGVNDAVAVFRRDAGTGVPSFLTRYLQGQGGIDGLAGARAVALSPDGLHVYVAGSPGTDGCIPCRGVVVLFDRDPASGLLTFRELYRQGSDGVDGITNAGNMLLSRDGSRLYVRGHSSLAVFDRDGQTGTLRFVESHFEDDEGIEGLQIWARSAGISIGLSPDGAHLYVANGGSGSVAAFAIQPVPEPAPLLLQLLALAAPSLLAGQRRARRQA